MDFGTQLKAMRAMRNLKQSELAELSGINQATISQMESGLIEPTPIYMLRLREALNWPRYADQAFEILAAEK